MPRELNRQQLVERSVTKKFRKEIWNNFIEGMQRYRLAEDGDRIAVCLDGGARSLLTAKLLQQLKRVSKTSFSLCFFVAAPDEKAMNAAKNNAAMLGIPLCETPTATPDETAASFGCNKRTSDENYSDAAAMALRDILYRSKLEALLPREISAECPTVELIRPLYCVNDDAVNAFVRYNALECAAPAAEDKQMQETRALIREQTAINPLIEHNIFKSLHAVCMDTLPGYIRGGVLHSFLDNYDK